jgi:hypothetical protein
VYGAFQRWAVTDPDAAFAEAKDIAREPVAQPDYTMLSHTSMKSDALGAAMQPGPPVCLRRKRATIC